MTCCGGPSILLKLQHITSEHVSHLAHQHRCRQEVAAHTHYADSVLLGEGPAAEASANRCPAFSNMIAICSRLSGTCSPREPKVHLGVKEGCMPAGNTRVGSALRSWCKSGMNAMLPLQADRSTESHALWAVHASDERG